MACFICLDEEDGGHTLSDVCACRDRRVHVACLVRWIETSGKTRCAACGSELRGVSVTTHVPIREHAQRVAWGVVVCCLIALSVYFVAIFVLSSVHSGNNGAIAASIVVAAYVLFVGVSWCVLMKRTYVTHTVRRVHVTSD
jgi:hypothetical protein